MKLTEKRHCSGRRNGKPKVMRVSPATIAKMDDTAIGLVIDKMSLPQVTFPGITRKSSVRYCPPRTVDKEATKMILKKNKSFNIEHVQRKILRMSCLKKSISQSEWFHRQLQKYIRIYHPDCPFKIAESEQLSGLEPEAAVFAKHSFQRGQTIAFLSGVIVPLTKKEELELEKSEKGFSLLSSRSRAAAMFLGPARFVNHDCKANAEIVRAERSRAHIVALKEIQQGEEITVFYGEHYFGKDNYECLCRSCTARIADS
ncbi:hypothetical protein N7448_011419 [Penicillium atrosanguineum]|nr:hypothetical protein N7448_011419 [Penicillium atrosanguineum]